MTDTPNDDQRWEEALKFLSDATEHMDTVAGWQSQPPTPAAPRRSDECMKCLYWERDEPEGFDEGTEWGECRINPPTVTGSTALGLMNGWPHTKEGQWCGQFTQDPRWITDPSPTEEPK